MSICNLSPVQRTLVIILKDTYFTFDVYRFNHISEVIYADTC